MRKAVLIDMVRTPFCKADKEKGWLASYRADDLGVILIKEMLKRNKLDPKLIDEVIIGASNQRESQAKPSRNITLMSGIPFDAASLSLDRECVSSMTAVHTAAMGIMTGMGDVYIAGGIESMTRFRIAKFSVGQKITTEEIEKLTGRSLNPNLFKVVEPGAIGMGMTAEKLAQVFKVPREAQDRWGLNSNIKADKAYKEGRFKNEIIPIPVQEGGQTRWIDRDQEIRPDSTLEKIATLPTPFKPVGGTVNAANASKESDGATMALLMSEEKAAALGYKPLATIRQQAVTGVDPTIMGYGATVAARKAIQRAGLSVDQIELWEINEAFAVVVLVAIQELGIKDAENRVNVNGGACCIGHPVGASGARIVGTLAREMERRKARYGVASICGGMGQGGAVVLERP